MKVEIFSHPYNPWDWVQLYQKEQSQLQHNFGATAVFVGTMRDFNEGDDVASMFLEHYPGMTEKSLEKIILDAIKACNLIDACIAHRVGDVFPGDPIVCVAVWSSHRKEAYEANRMIMEALKSIAPFWKKEQLGQDDQNQGQLTGRWVEKNTDGF
ncbi:MAG: molybdenum cofactor biosynthesis protein MoaE [Gammaproteobacteria bacterium]|nr:molybdenum cofactor biosynthesis protein MoaE [Gammaproteobacteria bacterium]